MNTLKLIARWIKDLWLVGGITIILFIALEAGLSLFFSVRTLWNPPNPNFRGAADTYSDRAWAISYFEEIDRIEQGHTMRWKPFTYWRRIPFQGKHITIQEDGLRKTIQSTSAEGPAKKRVFLFGGSTIWGLGSDDQTTIPSLFSREIQAKGISSEVVNYGQYAYVSTQGVLELIQQLQKGNVPDAVIFYDGVNDTFGAFQINVAGLAHGELEREQIYNYAGQSKLGILAARDAIQDLSIMRFAGGLLSKLRKPPDTITPPSLMYDKPISDKNALAQSVVDSYLNNMKIVNSLSKTYGFKFLCYWQPVIYLKPHLTEYEKQSTELDFNYPGMKEFYLSTYSMMERKGEERKNELPFHNISSIFRDTQDPIFVDFNHMGEKGNSVIARRMAEDFSKLDGNDNPAAASAAKSPARAAMAGRE